MSFVYDGGVWEILTSRHDGFLIVWANSGKELKSLSLVPVWCNDLDLGVKEFLRKDAGPIWEAAKHLFENTGKKYKELEIWRFK